MKVLGYMKKVLHDFQMAFVYIIAKKTNRKLEWSRSDSVIWLWDFLDFQAPANVYARGIVYGEFEVSLNNLIVLLIF